MSAKNKPVPKKPAAKFSDDDILNIYQDPTAGEAPAEIDMTKLDRGEQKIWRKRLLLIGGPILFLAVISFLGWWIFSGRSFSPAASNSVDFNLTGPAEIASGEIVELELAYLNNEKATLDSAEVSIHYPEGFYFQEAEPQPTGETNNTWRLSDIASGAGGKIKIKGQLVGEKNTTKSFSSLLIYRPANFQNDFQEVANHDIEINDSLIALTVDVPLRVQSGQEIEYRIKYKNTSDLPLPNLKVSLDYPAGFTPSEISPEPSTNNNIWLVDNLAENEEREIAVKGFLEGESGVNKQFTFKLGLLEPDGSFNLQIEKSTLLLIVNPDLELTLSGPATASPGEEIKYQVKIDNTSDLEIKNLEITIDFTGNSLKESQTVLETIDTLGPHQVKTLNYQTNVKKKLTGTSLEIRATAAVTQAEVEGENVSFEKTSQVDTKIKGEWQFSAAARYYADDLTKIGTGPLPPKVNETTTYVIFWQVTAGSNDLKDVSVSTVLPDDVLWVSTNNLNLEYDPGTRQVAWNLDQVDAQESKKGSFSISITPTPDDYNKLMVLTKSTVIQGQDSFLKETINQEIEQLTTDLSTDPAGQDKGVVVGN